MSIQRFLPQGGTVADARERGRDLRKVVRRSEQAELVLGERDPLATIERTHVGRIPELIPVRVSRMLQSVYAFYRGTVDVMTRDLAAGPVSGVDLVIAADAHLGNFGLYASPERRLVFDLNDFDEAGIGPWEWDVKRMVASQALVLRLKGVDAEAQREHVRATVERYRSALAGFVETSVLDRYFASVDAQWLLDEDTPTFQRSVDKAQRRTSEQALINLGVRGEDGRLVLKAEPPLLIHHPPGSLERTNRRFLDYRLTLHTDRALLLSQFEVVDVARRVVGVSSVGTHCSIALLQGPGDESLILQAKQAVTSVLEREGGVRDVVLPGAPEGGPGREAFRVVSSQRVLQSVSDPFLGWTVDPDGRNYYWRQFRDLKGSFDLGRADVDEVNRYARLCARQLARAHAQSPDSAAVAGYLGRSDSFATAIGEWAVAYADVVEEDFALFQEAVADGRFQAAGEGSY